MFGMYTLTYDMRHAYFYADCNSFIFTNDTFSFYIAIIIIAKPNNYFELSMARHFPQTINSWERRVG